jgi:hypothetical protein
MNQSDMLKITHKARVKFSIGNYIDTVDCDVTPLSACHLLLGRPWQFDLEATHGGCSNTYSFVHKGLSDVLKPMMETAMKVDIFPIVRKKKKDPPMDTPKPRTALLQGVENDVIVPGITTAPSIYEVVPVVAPVHCAMVPDNVSTRAHINLSNDPIVKNDTSWRKNVYKLRSLSCSEEMEREEDIINLISPTSDVESSGNIPKLRTTLFHGRNDDVTISIDTT